MTDPLPDCYSPREIAHAAGLAEEQVVARLGRRDVLVSHEHAVRLARGLLDAIGQAPGPPPPGLFDRRPMEVAERRRRLPLAVSGTVHAIIGATLIVASLTSSPAASILQSDASVRGHARLIFLAEPGPGGGGGGGGQRQQLAPPVAMRKGDQTVGSPVPARTPPPPIEPARSPADSDPHPTVVAPVAAMAADRLDRAGDVNASLSQTDSRGPGTNDGVGTGAGSGLGEGRGPGIGPGTGGGVGGGPFRAGSGIAPPRLLREVKADYTEDARRKNIQGEVIMEIVVRRDGSVDNVRLVRGLEAGLDESAVRSVRQWRFDAARRLGEPVDVIVEVAVEFKLR